MNLLQNPEFKFHSFDNHRSGSTKAYLSGNIAFWNTEAWGDIQVGRSARAGAPFRPAFSVENLAEIKPGKQLTQFFTLPEAGLAHGESVSLLVHGYQAEAGSLVARVRTLKFESADGEWSPMDFGMRDKRSFAKQGRGELVTADLYEEESASTGEVTLTIEDAGIIGKFTPFEKNSSSGDINTIGVQVEFANKSESRSVWVYAPALVKGAAAPEAGAVLASSREMKPVYRHIPRTMQKLWKGEPLHIISMGSSIDRGSANPTLYPYDEDPDSPTFKEPLMENHDGFEAERVGRPELKGYFGWWQHYFNYAGRMRLELMRKFNLPVDNILLNTMACDGSCIGESHSGFAEYAELSTAPSPGVNGHSEGASWEELYPGLFARPEGARPDLVIYGSGANETTDAPNEVAVFEGAIRWFQRNYPGVEFVFCMNQNAGQGANNGDLQALALRYQIPMVDYSLLMVNLLQSCNRFAWAGDGHPQAGAHFLWFKTLERAFESWDPIEAGQAQLHLPERLHPNSYGWEGDSVTFTAPDPRIKGPRMIIEDTAFNLWCNSEDKMEFKVDGTPRKGSRGRAMKARNSRNSTFVHGDLTLGDRHIVETLGAEAEIIAADNKVCPNRRFIGVDSGMWNTKGAAATDFVSDWGAPYGNRMVVLQPGASIEIDAVGTDLSVAFVDNPNAGTFVAFVDGVEKLRQPTNIAFETTDGEKLFIENRRGIRGLAYGAHSLRIEARDAPVAILGVFTYDSRSNAANERRLAGLAAPGDEVRFSPAFKARPIVVCHGGLETEGAKITPRGVVFGGSGPGGYEVIGE